MLDLSLLAIVLGAMIIVTRLPGIFFPRRLTTAFNNFVVASPGCASAFGLSLFLYAVVVLVTICKTDRPLELFMAIAGYLMAGGGVIFLYFPSSLQTIAAKATQIPSWFISSACVIGVVIGGALVYLGLKVY